MDLEVRFFSIKGNYRADNQDTLLVDNKIYNEIDRQTNKIAIKDNPVFAIADGMGGLECGKVASFLALEELSKCKVLNSGDFEILLKKISKHFKNIYPKKLIGTTLTVLEFLDDKILVFNIGDTRIYHLTEVNGENCLKIITIDHTLAYEAYLEKQISLDSIRNHPRKNILTSCITSNESSLREFNFNETPVKKGDLFLICSDGVWENFSINEIKRVFSYKRIGNIIKYLRFEKFNNAHDNMTAILIKVGEETQSRK